MESEIFYCLYECRCAESWSYNEKAGTSFIYGIYDPVVNTPHKSFITRLTFTWMHTMGWKMVCKDHQNLKELVEQYK